MFQVEGGVKPNLNYSPPKMAEPVKRKSTTVLAGDEPCMQHLVTIEHSATRDHTGRVLAIERILEQRKPSELKAIQCYVDDEERIKNADTISLGMEQKSCSFVTLKATRSTIFPSMESEVGNSSCI